MPPAVTEAVKVAVVPDTSGLPGPLTTVRVAVALTVSGMAGEVGTPVVAVDPDARYSAVREFVPTGSEFAT
jgi:hypothetical protein